MSDTGGSSRDDAAREPGHDPDHEQGSDTIAPPAVRQIGGRPADTVPVRARRGGSLDEPSARYASHEFVYSQPPDQEAGPQINIMAMLWRRRWVVLLCVLLGFGGAVWYLFQADPIYKSTAILKVTPNTPRLVGEGIGGTGSRNYLNTEVMVLNSSTMLEAALRTPGLLEGPSIKNTESPAQTVAGMLDIVPDDSSDVIYVNAEGLDKYDTQSVANALMEAYVKQNRASSQSKAATFTEILEGEIAKSDHELEEIHQRKIEMSRQVGTLDGDSGNIMVSQLGSLEEQINQAYSEVLDTRVLLKEVENAGDDEGLLRALLPVTQSANDDLWGSLRSLQRERQLLSLRLGEKNKQVQLLDARIGLLRNELAQTDQQTLDNAVRGLKARHAGAQARYDALKEAYDERLSDAFDANEERAEYERLLSRERRLNAQQDVLLARLQDIDVNTEVSGMNVSTLETAKTGQQIAPVTPQVIGMGLVLGTMLGLGLAFLLEWADPRLRDAEEIQQLLDVSILGAVPALDKRAGYSDRALHVAHHPNTETAEAFRDIRTVLFFELGLTSTVGTRIERADGPRALPGVVGGQVILVTSPLSGDGKTTSACNLAAAIADTGRRTLLLDADCRRPSVARYLDVDPETGLTNVLGVDERTVTLEEAIQTSEVKHLDVITCGPVPDRPAEMLNSANFADLLEELRGKYDVIVIDSPPVLPVTDARILSDKADATLLVLRAGSSTRRSARHAVDSLLRVNARLAGVLVNGVPLKKRPFGYGQKGGYGYYYRYSYTSHKNEKNGAPNGKANKEANGAANGHEPPILDA